MKQRLQTQPQPLTLAEVCEAIANGRIPAKVEDGYYTVSQRELRQLRQESGLRHMPKLQHPAGLAS